MTGNNRYLFQKGFSAMIMATAFLIPVSPGLVPLAIILTSMIALFSGELVRNVNKVIDSVPVVLLILFYVLHIVGLLYTDNIGAAKIDLEIKLSLILFPVLLISFKEIIFSYLYKILEFYVAGVVSSMIICLIHSCYLTMNIGGNHFFYKDFSFYMHPGYLSLYYNLATILLYHIFIKRVSFLKEWMFVSTLILITAGTILLNSKSGMIIQVMILIYIFFIHREKVGIFFNRIRISSIILILMLILAGFIIPVSSHRMIGFVDIARKADDTQAMSHSTQGMRFLAWDSSVHAIKGSPVFGFGTGDGKDVLVGIYNERKFYDLAELRLNSHNQFLTTWLAVGIPGVVLILFSLLAFIFFHWKIDNHMALAFIFIIVLNMMVESVLEVSAGTVYFGYFISLFEANRLYQLRYSHSNTDIVP